MTTVRFSPPDGFKREFLEDGTIKATCDYCGEVLLGQVSTRVAAENQHRLGCQAPSKASAGSYQG
jgi:hypothetical protein